MRNFVTIFLIMSFILLLQGCTQSKSISQKNNSNNLKKINNPSKINQYIKEPEYTIIRTNRYYATDNATYIRCDIYLEPTVCYVKKLYIGESTKPFYENEYITKNKINKLDFSTGQTEMLYDGTYTLGPSSFDNKYHIICNYDASTTDGSHELIKILNTKLDTVIYEFLGAYCSWANNSYELLFSYNNSTKHLLINDTGDCVITEFNEIDIPYKYNN